MSNVLGRDIQSLISAIVTSNDVVLFMKGTKEVPLCGFSGYVVKILGDLGVDFFVVNVLADEEVRAGIKTYTNWMTIPQLFIRGEFVGGYDVVRELHEREELAAKFKVDA